MVGFLEGPDLIIVLVIVLLVFGGSRLPQLARSVGEAQREFKNAMADTDNPSATGAADRGAGDSGTPASAAEGGAMPTLSDNERAPGAGDQL